MWYPADGEHAAAGGLQCTKCFDRASLAALSQNGKLWLDTRLELKEAAESLLKTMMTQVWLGLRKMDCGALRWEAAICPGVLAEPRPRCAGPASS
jgi:hypothetical protein